jgi:hypothetical protein
MHPLEALHQTLRMAGLLLDSAASQIRDAPLPPVRDNILKIAAVLAEVSELRLEIQRAAPELNLEPKHEPPSPEVSAANQRLGKAFLAADDLSVSGRRAEAIRLLEAFAQDEVLEPHKTLAASQAENYRRQEE